MSAPEAAERNPLGRNMWWLGAFVALAIVRLSLVAFQKVSPANLQWDDRLYVDLAGHLIAGDWLGPFDARTLVKGPGYAFWVAGVSVLGVPLLLAQHLLYVTASALMTVALRPLLRHSSLSLLVFGLLLTNPMSANSGLMTAVYRNGIYPAETLFVVACSIALATRPTGSAGRLALWSAGLGASMAALWVTREEGIWLVPTVLLLLAVAAVRIIRSTSGRPCQARLVALVIPLLLWPVGVGAVALKNLRHYGVFEVADVKSQEYEAALGALSRAGAPDYKPFIPVTARVLRQIYDLSPAGAALRPHLEGDIARWWAQISEDEFGEDIAGGWLPFALRWAVARSGYYTSAPVAAAYYRQLADEINAACDAGRLACGARRDSALPLWRNAYVWPMWKAMVRGSMYLGTFADFEPEPTAHAQPPSVTDLYRRVTHEPLALPEPVTLRGWVEGAGSEVQFVVRRPNGTQAETKVQFPNDESNGSFALATVCPAWCTLEVRQGERLAATVPLDGRPRTLERKGLLVRLEAVPERAARSALGLAFARARLRLLYFIGRVFRWVTPPAALLALVLYLVTTARVVATHRAGIAWWVTTALLGALISRIMVLSLVEITACRAFWPGYMSPNYPLLLVFIAVVFVSAVRQAGPTEPDSAGLPMQPV